MTPCCRGCVNPRNVVVRKFLHCCWEMETFNAYENRMQLENASNVDVTDCKAIRLTYVAATELIYKQALLTLADE